MIIAFITIYCTNTKIGRGRPYELALIGSWIIVWLMFSMPEDATMAVKAARLFCLRFYKLDDLMLQIRQDIESRNAEIKED